MFSTILSFFGGFLLSSILDTTISEFHEWNIVGAALIVASLEIMNKVIYTIRRNNLISSNANRSLTIINNLKLGLIYGLIVDALKLGS